MTNEKENTENTETNRPDYIAKQYRVIATEDGYKTPKERIGVVYINENGSMCFRPSGAQLIESDVYFFPFEEAESQQ